LSRRWRLVAGWSAGALLAFVIFAILFPVFARVNPSRYRVMLEWHDSFSQRTLHGSPAILSVSWFHHGKVNWGDDIMAFANGELAERRFIPDGVQGGWGPAWNKKAFHELAALASLPPGLANPDDVAHGRLVIISLNHKGRVTTCFYDDLHQTPASARIVNVAKAAAGENSDL
jgi:hypothetical protein